MTHAETGEQSSKQMGALGSAVITESKNPKGGGGRSQGGARTKTRPSAGARSKETARYTTVMAERRTNVSRDDIADLRRAMERFDDKLDKSFQGQQTVQIRLGELESKVQLHRAEMNTRFTELQADMKLAKKDMEIDSAEKRAPTESALATIKVREAIIWSIVIGTIGFLAAVAKDWITKVLLGK